MVYLESMSGKMKLEELEIIFPILETPHAHGVRSGKLLEDCQ